MALNLTINAAYPPLGELQSAIIARMVEGLCLCTHCDSYLNKSTRRSFHLFNEWETMYRYDTEL